MNEHYFASFITKPLNYKICSNLAAISDNLKTLHISANFIFGQYQCLVPENVYFFPNFRLLKSLWLIFIFAHSVLRVWGFPPTTLSTSKIQQSILAAIQRFTRTITLLLNWSAAEQAVANRQCIVWSWLSHFIIVLSLLENRSAKKNGLLKSLAPVLLYLEGTGLLACVD